MSVAKSASGGTVSAFRIMPCLYYPYLLAASIVYILVRAGKKEINHPSPPVAACRGGRIFAGVITLRLFAMHGFASIKNFSPKKEESGKFFRIK